MNKIFYILLIALSASCSPSKKNLKSDSVNEMNNNCEVNYETHLKKKDKKKSIIDSRHLSNANPYSQISIVNVKINCKNNEMKLINDIIYKNTLKSEIYSERNFDNIDELLNTIDYSGLSEEDSTVGFEEAAEFIHLIDNEVIHLNEEFISIKKTESHQFRIGNVLTFYSTLTMKIATGEIIELRNIIKKGKKSQLQKMINDSLEKYKDDLLIPAVEEENDITNLYNISSNEMYLYYTHKGNIYATIKFKKEFINEYLEIDFWK